MPRVAKPQAKTRIQLDLSQREVDQMNKLMEQCDIETRKDLFTNALSMLEWAIGEVKMGFNIASVEKRKEKRGDADKGAPGEKAENAETITTLAMPILNNVAQTKT